MIDIGTIKIPLDENNIYADAIKYLQDLSNQEDVVDLNLVKISTSLTSTTNLKYPILKKSDDINYYFTASNPGEFWYEIDFLNNQFYLDTYLIRASDQEYFKEWKVLGSNDGIHYSIIDHIKDFTQPKNDYCSIPFKCQFPNTYRFIRLWTHGKRFNNDDLIFIHRLEFYGAFISSSSIKTSHSAEKFSMFTFPISLKFLFILCVPS